MPDVYKFGYEATDANAPAAIMERGLQAMLYKPMRRLLDDKQPDVIISTYPLYQAPLGAVFSLTRKFIPLVTVVTDLVTVHHVWFSAYPDLTVVPTEAVRDLAIAARVPAEQIEVIGIPVHPAPVARDARQSRHPRRVGLGSRSDDAARRRQQAQQPLCPCGARAQSLRPARPIDRRHGRR